MTTTTINSKPESGRPKRLGLFASAAVVLSLTTLFSGIAYANEDFPLRNYDIIEFWNNGVILEVEGGSGSDGAHVIAYHEDWHGANQRWRVRYAGDDANGRYWYIENLNSNLYLDVEAGRENGWVIQFRWLGGANQQWYIRRDGQNGSRYNIVSRATGQVITFLNWDGQVAMRNWPQPRSSSQWWPDVQGSR